MGLSRNLLTIYLTIYRYALKDLRWKDLIWLSIYFFCWGRGCEGVMGHLKSSSKDYLFHRLIVWMKASSCASGLTYKAIRPWNYSNMANMLETTLDNETGVSNNIHSIQREIFLPKHEQYTVSKHIWSIATSLSYFFCTPTWNLLVHFQTFQPIKGPNPLVNLSICSQFGFQVD